LTSYYLYFKDGDDMDGDEMEDEPIDIYDIQDPINVLEKIPKGFFDTIV